MEIENTLAPVLSYNINLKWCHFKHFLMDELYKIRKQNARLVNIAMATILSGPKPGHQVSSLLAQSGSEAGCRGLTRKS